MEAAPTLWPELRLLFRESDYSAAHTFIFCLAASDANVVGKPANNWIVIRDALIFHFRQRRTATVNVWVSTGWAASGRRGR